MVDATPRGMKIDPGAALDMTPTARGRRTLGSGGTRVYDGASEGCTDALSTGAALLASEQVGIAQWCLETTVAT